MAWQQDAPAGDMATGRRRAAGRGAGEHGFTLVELMVIVLILGVLLAVAIPTFLGSRERAANRRAQAHVRLTYVTQTIFAIEARAFTDDPVALKAVDGSITYTDDVTDITAGSPPEKTVFVDVATENEPDDTVLVGARSSTGECFWLRANLKTPVSFASNDCSGPPAPADLGPRW